MTSVIESFTIARSSERKPRNQCQQNDRNGRQKKTKQKLEKLVAVVSLDALLEVTKELQQATKTGREHFACQDNGLFHIFKVIVSSSEKIYRGYYIPVRGYEFYLRVVNSISHE